MSSLEVSRKTLTVVHAITGGPMPFQPNENHRARDLPSECGLADQERAARRKLNAAHIDPAASNWRYRPTRSIA